MRDFATYSRELSIMTLTSRVKNLMCLYHHHKTSAKYTNDIASEDADIKVTGVPYGRIATAKKARSVDFAGGPVEAGVAFSCGCATESVLLDYFMWKSVRVTSESTKRKEGWKYRVMDPRTRAFSLEAIESFGGIRIDDLYFKDTKNRSQNDQFSVTKQIDRLIAENIDALHQNRFRQSIAKVIIK